MSTTSRFAPLGMAFFLAACGGNVSPSSSSGTDSTRPSTTNPASATFDVSTLPGLSLWLQSTKGIVFDKVHTRVLGWNDQSPSHNDLALKQGVGATRDGIWLGQTPTVAFDGASAYQFPAGTPLSDWSGDFLIEIVVHAQYTKALGSQGLFSCVGAQSNVAGSTVASIYLSGGQTMECKVDSDGYSNGSATKPVVDPTGYVISFQRSGAVLTSRRNGAVDKTQTFDHVTSPLCTSSMFGAMDLDATGAPTSFLSSDVAEVIVSKGTTPSATVTSLETALMAKYQIGTSND
ncbi:MAG: hypothetical protein ABI461_13140 [Polyangiaceae bacterium]